MKKLTVIYSLQTNIPRRFINIIIASIDAHSGGYSQQNVHLVVHCVNDWCLALLGLRQFLGQHVQSLFVFAFWSVIFIAEIFVFKGVFPVLREKIRFSVYEWKDKKQDCTAYVCPPFLLYWKVSTPEDFKITWEKWRTVTKSTNWAFNMLGSWKIPKSA